MEFVWGSKMSGHVEDLARALRLTDNAVRNQLRRLVAANLAVRSGLRPGPSKPSVLYAITRDVDPDLEHSLRLPVKHGALVQDIAAGSPGDRAGLRPYDVIVSLDDRDIGNDDQLIREIASRAPGSPARLHVLRDGREQTLTVKLAERPVRNAADGRGDATPQPADRPRNGADGAFLGLNVRDLDRQTIDRLELPKLMKGVLIARVEAMSTAFDGGIERGTVLLEVNRQRVESVADYRRLAAAARPGDILTLYVYSPDLDQRQLKTVRVEGR